MIEVHLVRFERVTAIDARASPQLAQHLHGAALPNSYSFELDRSVSAVIGPVRGTLIPAGHKTV
jgi:hypothetical protein